MLALSTNAASLLPEKSTASSTTSPHPPKLRIEPQSRRAGVQIFSWDTEGGNKTQTNLLRANCLLDLRVRIGGIWARSEEMDAQVEQTEDGLTSYKLHAAHGANIYWLIHSSPTSLVMAVQAEGDRKQRIEAVEMRFPFDPQVTPTTMLPTKWSEDGTGQLPSILSSPDFGQLLLKDQSASPVRFRLEGDRKEHTLDVILELPGIADGESHALSFTPLHLSPPRGMTDMSLWQQVRRGWFNTWQPSSKWGDQSRPYSAPAGILANNVISDPVSFALPFYADQAFWTPEIAAGISVMSQVRRTIEWWLEHRTDSSGEVIGYWNYHNFLDANPGILISAWDYVEATGDHAWLWNYIVQLERLSLFLERRDIDGDGMVEATQSGNYGTLIEPGRSCCWWDALNCGHKDGYSNAYIYRAWRCLAELEGQLGRVQHQKHYTLLAEQLKSAYFKTLYNPATGWLSWWKSEDGQLHDYATPIVNGLAIEYGLVEPNEARKILARIWGMMRDAGFTRFDLGLPCTLKPVLRADYLLPDGLGIPHRADGTDTFQDYMNGGISAGHTLHFIMAHHNVGEPDKGDEILRAMLNRQSTVGFQDGVQNKANAGIDWTTWSGAPKGYEGYLADVFMFLQAAVLREPSLRARFYRPLKLPGILQAPA